jgi:hypothetical protein
MRRRKVYVGISKGRTLSQRGFKFITGADHTKLVHKAHELKRTPHLHSNGKGWRGRGEIIQYYTAPEGAHLIFR